MSRRDSHGHYINDAGVTIEVHQDKNGKDHINFYNGPADGNHEAVHVNVDYKNGGSVTYNMHGLDHSNTDSDTIKCFLTTACMQAMAEKFDDRCYELQVLRWFRDHHVSQEDISHYYRVAPAIVAELNRRADKHDIYQRIYNEVILPCVRGIEQREFDFVYETYRHAVLQLEETILNQ